MRRHPREQRCVEAEVALSSAILDITQKHALTEAEALRVVNAACSSWIGNSAKYAIREERHGNTDTPGGRIPSDSTLDPLDCGNPWHCDLEERAKVGCPACNWQPSTLPIACKDVWHRTPSKETSYACPTCGAA
jgi:hypothetical protein